MWLVPWQALIRLFCQLTVLWAASLISTWGNGGSKKGKYFLKGWRRDLKSSLSDFEASAFSCFSACCFVFYPWWQDLGITFLRIFGMAQDLYLDKLRLREQSQIILFLALYWCWSSTNTEPTVSGLKFPVLWKGQTKALIKACYIILNMRSKLSAELQWRKGVWLRLLGKKCFFLATHWLFQQTLL
jgi:hypothetical protein